MAIYHWDFAVDMNAANQNPGPAYLQNGFAQYSTSTGTSSPATPVNLNVGTNGDTVQFFLYDVTVPGSSPYSSYSISSATINFGPADVGGTTSPFAPAVTLSTAVSSLGDQSSALFGGGTSTGLRYPAWSLGGTTTTTGYTVANSGRFLLTVTVEASVTNTNGTTNTVLFQSDPEMVTGGFG